MYWAKLEHTLTSYCYYYHINRLWRKCLSLFRSGWIYKSGMRCSLQTSSNTLFISRRTGNSDTSSLNAALAIPVGQNYWSESVACSSSLLMASTSKWKIKSLVSRFTGRPPHQKYSLHRLEGLIGKDMTRDDCKMASAGQITNRTAKHLHEELCCPSAAIDHNILLAQGDIRWVWSKTNSTSFIQLFRPQVILLNWPGSHCTCVYSRTLQIIWYYCLSVSKTTNTYQN